MDTSVVLYNPNAGADVIRAINEPAISSGTAEVILVIGGLAILALFIGYLFSLIERSAKRDDKVMKSKDYRALISDMFVAGKVRQIATEEKVDLDAEYKRFKKWDKKDYLKGAEIDEAVSINLRDKITEKAESEMDNLKP
jgi:hypothetical protein